MHNIDKSGDMAVLSLACNRERREETWKEKWMLAIEFRSETCEPLVAGKSTTGRSQLDFSGAVELEKEEVPCES